MMENNILFRRIIEEIEDYSMLLLDGKGTILNWNKGAGKIKGYQTEEVIGKPFDLFYPKKDLEKKLPETLIKDAAQNGKATHEGWILRKDGTSFWGSNQLAAIHDEEGKIIGFSMTTHDLTGKKSTAYIQKALEQTREGLMKLFNASPTGMIIADIEMGRLIEVNASFLSTFGYKREEAIGFTANELGFVSNETQLKSFTKLKQQGYLRNEEVPARTKNGKKVDTLFSVELFEMDGRSCFLCIFHDISNLKEMEKKLVENENKYRKLIDEAGDVLYTSDALGKFTYINQRVTNLTEYSIEDLIGKHFSTLIAPEWQEKVQKAYAEQFKSRTHETIMEFRILTKSGKEKWVEQIVIMQQTQGRIEGFQCIVHDITERKKATLLLAEQKKIIEQKNKNILDSINYAKRIQDVIFPPEELIRELLPQSFVLFKPKDVIGGDFYWLEKFDNKIFIAAVDCTGHGVPGALLSIIGYNLLSKSINERGHTRPSDILNELSNGINKTLRKNLDSTSVKDTMDIALCSIDKETNTLEFAGAHNSLYIIRKNELIEIVADRFPIGVILNGELQKFTNHKIQLEKGDTIYLFSDGYPDQFGGPDGKKLKYNGFKKILLSIQNTPVHDQKKVLDKTFEEWKQINEDQTDDILIVGVRV
jgi:PAS domain S-box-containing protein